VTSDPYPPSAEGPTALPAPDQTERLILELAETSSGCPCDVVTVDDTTGVLTAEALTATAGHRSAHVLAWTTSHQNAQLLRALHADAVAQRRLVIGDGQDLATFLEAADAHLVLMRLPKSLAALEDRAAAIATGLGSRRDDVELIAGGRVKHMSRSQNEVLARYFGEVHASRGLGKSRCLVATEPRAESAPSRGASTSAPRIAVRGEERDLTLHGIGGVFGGASADAGSRLLLSALDRALAGGHLATAFEDSEPRTILDLGSGNGLLAAYATSAFPHARVIASDDDLDAVAATRDTLAASASGATDAATAADVEVTWDTSASQVPDGSVDLVLLNPPFHDRAAVDPTLVRVLLDAAARVLKPGGLLWFVHNSHLRYRPEVERRVGAVRQQARDHRFTVLEATQS
jgi:16S rRNA (guanine1207-N2)-methyltransferase